MFDVNNLVAIQIGLASPEKIREWSHGEVTKPETINYRSQKPEPDGLFCERIFGPAKDYECHCGKYKKSRFKGIICDKCGVEITTKAVRRERMGSIELASPCAHIWYLKGIPAKMGLVLDISPKQLEEIVYFKSHVCLNPGTAKNIFKKQVFDDRTGRLVFQTVIEKEILPTLDKDTYDYQEGASIVERLLNPQEPFSFSDVSYYVSRFTNAEFGIGAEAIQRLLSEVDIDKEFDKIQEELKEAQGQKRTKLIKRLETIEAFKTSKNKPEWMVLDVLPVIPPDLRPMLPLDGGRFATSDLNDLYRRVINRNNRLKKLIDINSPDVILMNEKRMLQEAVDSLIDNGRKGKPVLSQSGKPYKSLSTSLKGKSGRFRQNLLGKRVDFSGRSVIAVGPSLKMYQCGLPMEMAVQLFRPFIASIMIKEEIATSHKQANKMIDHYDAKVLDVAERVVAEHPVLLNRAPTLHRLGIQAFRPIIVAGHAIRLHPLVCTAFNADFDGDQMAVHVPLSQKAQEEAINLMLASNNILGPKDGKPIVTPSQDMILGNYYLTLESDVKFFQEKANKLRAIGDEEEAEKYDLYAQCEGKVFSSIDEIMLAYQTKQIHLHNRIAIKGSSLHKSGFTDEMNDSYMITTVGKVIFNQIFPDDFPFLNVAPTDKQIKNLLGDQDIFFVHKGTNIKEYIASLPLRRPFIKKDITAIIDEVFHRYHNPRTSQILDKLKDQGFSYSTISGITVSIDDVALVQGKEEILKEGDEKVEKITRLYTRGIVTDKERHDKVIKVWENVKDQISKKLETQLLQNPRNPIYMMSDSGARGNMSNFLQLSGLRGLMSNPSGETIELPIKSCFREGLTVSEFFIATHGARKGGADTALKTADSGYLTRRLVDVSHDVIIREEDCGTDHGTFVEEVREPGQKNAIVPLFDRLVGRFSCHDIVDPNTGEIICPENTLMDEEIAHKIVNAGITRVEIRSLFGCETKDGVCVHCYGRNMASGNIAKVGDTVGIMAAQSIGEPGTQLTMRTFHTGGVAGSDITQGLPRVQELFEARKPKGEAIISEIAGTVKSIDVDEKNKSTIVVANELEEKSYTTVIGAHVIVAVGDKVINGQPLTSGAINPKTLLNVADVSAVEKYIVQEVHKVYRIQGIDISDKHIEVIVKQMLRKIVVVDSGDTDLLPGTRIEINRFTEANEKAILENKRPAVGYPRVLGITKAALDTESFLSSASFQETTKVLTDAAIKGSVDHLHGLKENVMIGKLIPAGESFVHPEVEEEKEEKEVFNEEDKDIVLPETDLEDDNMIKFTDLFDDDSDDEIDPSLENKDE